MGDEMPGEEEAGPVSASKSSSFDALREMTKSRVAVWAVAGFFGFGGGVAGGNLSPEERIAVANIVDQNVAVVISRVSEIESDMTTASAAVSEARSLVAREARAADNGRAELKNEIADLRTRVAVVEARLGD